MDFIDGKRPGEMLTVLASGHPFLILPLVIQIPNDRSGFGRDLMKESVGIRLVDLVIIVARDDVIFVMTPLPYAGDKRFPNSGLTSCVERMAFFIPAVEVAHDEHVIAQYYANHPLHVVVKPNQYRPALKNAHHHEDLDPTSWVPHPC